MCELLVRVVDKVPGDDFRSAMFTKAGDVIYVAEDQHVWGTEEIANPEWRIIRMPGVSAASMSDMMREHENPRRKGHTLAKRRVTFDLADPWVKGLVDSGHTITLSRDDAKKLNNRRKLRDAELVKIVG
jgi:hypothetical protein